MERCENCGAALRTQPQWGSVLRRRLGDAFEWLLAATERLRLAVQKVFTRTKAFVLERLFPVAMLWLGIVWGGHMVPATYDFFKNGTNALADVGRLVEFDSLALPLLGVAAIKVVFSTLDFFRPFKPEELVYIRKFLRRLWDEISGAATHLSCSVAVASFWGGYVHNAMLLCIASLLLGWVAYRFKPNEEKTALVTP